MSAFDELVREYWELNARAGDRSIVGRFNKVKELLGEEGARTSAMSAFKVTQSHLVAVPVRNNKVPILDLLYELDDGSFVLLEAKYDQSQLGRTNDRRTFLVGVEGGQVKQTPLVLKDQVEQLSPQWVKQRIDEIAKHDAALADRLRKAADSDKLHILEVRSRLEADGRLSSVTTDRTREYREWSGRRLNDAERRFARREALSRLYAAEAKTQAAAARAAADKAKKAAADADKAVARIEKSIAKLEKEPGKRQATIAKRKAELEALQKELPLKKIEAERLHAEHTKTEAVAEQAREKYEQNLVQADNDARARRAEATHKRLETQKKLAERAGGGAAAADAAKAAEAEKAVAGGAKAERATATASKGVGTRMVEREVATAGRLGAAAKAANFGKTAIKVAAAAPRRAVYQLYRGAKVIARVGVKVFTVIELANPVFDLLMLVDIVDSLVAWLDRDRINDRREWARLFDFFFGEKQYVTSSYGIVYQTSMYSYIDEVVEKELGNEANPRNFVYFLNRWESDKSWAGFVYAQIDVANINRQEQQDSDSPYAVKYYLPGAVNVTFVEKPLPNYRKQGEGFYVGAQDERNWSTFGRPAPYASPEYSITVKISRLDLRITHPAPSLTPFDFIIAKCRGLIGEIVDYVSRHDERVYEGMSVAEEVYGLGDITHKKQYWLEGMQFHAPLVSENVHSALLNLLGVIEFLSAHSPRKGDGEIWNEKWTRGYLRRLLMLREVATGRKEFRGRRIMEEVSSRVLNLVKAEDETLRELSDYAQGIDDDLRRTYQRCQSTNTLEFNYQGGLGKP